MRKSQDMYFIITTMDGVPMTQKDGTITQYISTDSMRNTAKHLTFRTGERHHTRGLPKDKRFKAKKHYNEHGYIPLGFLT